MKKVAISSMVLAGLVVMFLLTFKLVSQADRPAIALSLRGFRTNETGSVCVVAAVTNSTTKAYTIRFATEIKTPAGWTSPSRLAIFGATSGDSHLGAKSEQEFPVTAVTSSVPWRVTAVYIEIPNNSPKYLILLRLKLGSLRPHFLATPEISSSPTQMPGTT